MSLVRHFLHRRRVKPSVHTQDDFERVPEFELSKDRIRLIVFKDSDDKRGRSLLFDSKSIKLVETFQENNPSSFSTLKSKCGVRKGGAKKRIYEMSRVQSDVKMLGEMIFGCVDMAYYGSSLKVHSVRTPSQVMLTKVFSSWKPIQQDSEPDESSSGFFSSTEMSSPSFVSSTSENGRSNPLNIGSPESGVKFPGGDLAASASSSSLASLYASPSSQSSGNFYSSSYNGMHRRFLRYHATSMEHAAVGAYGRTRSGGGGAGSHSADSAASDILSYENSSVSAHRLKTKFGIALIVELLDLTQEHEKANSHFEKFFFSHIPLIESHLNKLEKNVEMKYHTNKKNFGHEFIEEYDKVGGALLDLYLTPRLAHPAWLALATQPDSRHHPVVTDRFMHHFMALSTRYDGKANNFFMTTLLTAVLTHHLAWIPTVTPAGSQPSQAYMEKHTAKWLDMLNKSHPYNPLWAQLGDLYGAIGYPSKIARTVILSEEKEVAMQILYVLSYFVRCSEVYENSVTRGEEEDQLSSATSADGGGVGATPCRRWSTGSNFLPTGTGAKVAMNLHSNTHRFDNDAVSLFKDKESNEAGYPFDAQGNLVRPEEPVYSDGCGFTGRLNSSGDLVSCMMTKACSRGGDLAGHGPFSTKAAALAAMLTDRIDADGISRTVHDVESEPARTGSNAGKESVQNNKHIVDDQPMFTFGKGVNTRTVTWDAFSCTQEVSLPRVKRSDTGSCSLHESFGSSLSAGYTEHYVSDFVTQATKDKQLWPKLYADLSVTAQSSVLDEPVSEAVCIVADVDNWTVKLVRSHRQASSTSCQVLALSQMVANMLDSLRSLWRNNLPPDLCAMYIEDQLQEFYFQSKTLVEYLRSQNCINMSELASVLGFDESDFNLLLAVASTHSPHITFGL